MKLAVVLPAYNEAGNITPLVDQLRRAAETLSIDLQIIVVNDGSADGTAAELAGLVASVPELLIVTHPVNRGLAQALKTGIATACREQCDAALFMDCDLSQRPREMSRFVDALTQGADVVIGSRFAPGGGMLGVPLWRSVISRAGNTVGRWVLGMPVHDLTTGYRAVRRNVLEAVTLSEDGFTIQLESVVKAFVLGFRIVEVPITLETRRHGRSHMRYSADLFRNYYRLLMQCRRWLRARRVSSPSSGGLL